MKKPAVIISSLLISFASILFLNQLFKFALTLILDVSSKLVFSGISLHVSVIDTAKSGPVVHTLIILSPFIASIILIESAFWLLSKTANNNTKSILIIYLLINAGYLILSVIMGVFSLLFKVPLSGEWTTFFSHGELNYDKKLLYLFMFMLLLLGYINLITKRIKRVIPVIMKKN